MTVFAGDTEKYTLSKRSSAIPDVQAAQVQHSKAGVIFLKTTSGRYAASRIIIMHGAPVLPYRDKS